MVTPEIIDYIKKKRQEGMTDDAIRQDLTKGMWSDDDIHIAFTSIDKGTPIPSAPAQSQVDTRTIVVILALVLCYPVGLIFMWWWMKRWSLWIKIIITSVWAIFFLLYLGIFALSFSLNAHNSPKRNSYQTAPMQPANSSEENPLPSQSPVTPNQPLEVLPTATPTPISTPGVNVTTAPTGTTNANGVCVADNGCKFRSPGSGYRCDTNGNFSADGTKYCSCNKDCSVTIQ